MDRLEFALPEQVKKFLIYFQDMIKVGRLLLLPLTNSYLQEGNVYEVNTLYETSFPKLTDQYFKV